MSYLGKTPSQATRARYYYTATGGETSLSGSDDNGNTLVFSDGNYVDVMLNGVTLVAGTDYDTDTANTIDNLSALTASDVVEIVVYDTFSVFGGNVNGNFNIQNGTLTASSIAYPTTDGTSGQVITTDGSGTLSFTTIASDKIEEGNSSVEVVDSGTGRVDVTVDGSEIVRFDASGLSFDAGSNHLDDYEEGTFTPTLLSGSCSGTCRYIKIGALVFVHSEGSLTHATDGSGPTGVTINNLPFVVVQSTIGVANGSSSLFDSGATATPLIGGTGGTGNAVLSDYPSGSGANASRWLSGTFFSFTLIYYTSA